MTRLNGTGTISGRAMALTPELVALCEREELEPNGVDVGTLLTDQDFQALARRLADESSGQPLWTFAYGSLIWKPAFEAIEQRRGAAFGWHRSFCLEIRRWRGSPEQPGLMMALDRGGRCDGVAYRLSDEGRPEQIERLLRREIDAQEDIAAVRWLTVRTADGPVRALAFWVGPSGDGVLRRLPLVKVAGTIARACGHAGSCADYLYRTVLHLEQHGIHDRNLWQLQELVAAEIRLLHRMAA